MKNKKDSTIYARSYLVTLGLLFVTLPAIAILFSPNFKAWPMWVLAICLLAVVGGVWLISLGLFGADKAMEDLAAKASTHEASLVIMALAVPVYWILSLFYNRR